MCAVMITHKGVLCTCVTRKGGVGCGGYYVKMREDPSTGCVHEPC